MPNSVSQTFLVSLPNTSTNSKPAGCFLTKIDLYFAEKDATSGFFFDIREVDQTSYVTKNILPYSQVYVPASSINTSNTAATATTVTFPSLVFVQNDTEYAFTIRPEFGNSGLYIYTSILGQEDIASGTRIVEQPNSGVMLFSANDRTWSPSQLEDIKYKLYCANFTQTSGTARFINRKCEYLRAANPTKAYAFVGEPALGEVRANLSNISGTISIGHTLYGNASTVTGVVTDISGSTYRLKNVGLGNTYTTNEILIAKYSNGTATGATARFASAGTQPKGMIEFYKFESANNVIIHLEKASGNFANGEQIRCQLSNTAFDVVQSYNLPYGTMNFEPSQLEIADTAIKWQVKTTANTGTKDATYKNVAPGINTEFASERIIKSRTIGEKSAEFLATLVSENTYVTPVIDTTRTHMPLVLNLINNTNTGEDAKSGGSALARYITQKVTLAEGQDAEDLKVFITAYRPPDTTIELYYKLLNGEDADNFDDVEWTQMEMLSNNVFSSNENKNDFKEYEFGIPEAELNVNGIVEYINSRGITFTGFKYFAFKIVLLSSNTSIVPVVDDLRAIALQV